MPPKSSEGSKRASTSKGNKDKQPAINTDTLCDENWACDIVFFYEGDKEGNDFITLLQQIPTKQVAGVKIICKNDILKETKKGGGKVSKKGDSKGKGKDEVVEITDEQKVMKCVKENSAIPGAPLAGLVKKWLINFKVEDINERRKEESAFINAQKKPKKPQTKENKKGIKPDNEPVNDNENAEVKFVERLPLFVVLFGFNEHDLPAELLKLEIPLRAVVKLVESDVPEIDIPDVPPEIYIGERDDRSLSFLKSEKFNMTWLKFWNKFDLLMNKPEYADLGNDLAVIKYQLSQDLKSSKVNIKDKRSVVVNQLTDIMNYTRYLLERYKAYKDNLNIVDISQSEFSTENPDLHNTLMEMVPSECISIPVILFSIVEQVCHWNGDEIEVENAFDDSFSSYDDSDIIKNKFRPNKRPIKCNPALIRHNDEHSIRTFHLEIPEIDFNRILIRFLSKSHLFHHWQNIKKQDRMLKYYFDFHLQRLWKLMYRDISLKLFYIYFHWYILCKMKTYYLCDSRAKRNASRGSVDKCRHNTEVDFLDEWLRDCGINELNDNPELSEKMSDDTNETITITYNPDRIDEEHNDSNKVSGEESQESLLENNPNNYRSTNSIIKNRNRSLLTLRKFLYCPEIYCLCENDNLPSVSNFSKLFSCYKFIEEMPAEALLQAIQQSLFDFSQVNYLGYHPSNKTLLWFHNTKQTIFEKCKSGHLDTSLGFRDYYSTIIVPEEELLKQKYINASEETVNDHNQEVGAAKSNESHSDIIDERNNKFVYGLGKKNMLFNEHIKRYVSEDGTSVTVKTDDSYRSSQSINICVSKIDINMYIYLDKLALLERDSDEYELKSNVPTDSMKVLVRFPNDTLLNVKVEELTSINDKLISPSWFVYKDLKITLPSGLLIEVVNNIYNNEIYIKQSYTAKGPNCSKIWDETCRCFTKSGAIIIFKNDETIEVLYGNTTVAKICRVAVEEHEEEVVVPEVIVRETQGKDKDTKKKGKSKEKEIPVMEVPEIQEEVVPKLPYKVIEHVIKSWSGINYSYKEGQFDEITEENVNLRTIFEPYKRLYIDRNDGIKCLFTDNGDLVTTFSDNTLLTTYCYEEHELIHVDKDHDVEEDTDQHRDSVKQERFSSNASNYIAQGEDSIDGRSDSASDEMYVSYKLGCIAEHPSYATVEFSPESDSIKLILPGDITVVIQDIQSDGKYNFKAIVAKKSCLEFYSESITFQSNILKLSKYYNITTLSPLLIADKIFTDASYFCKTTDSFNYMFMVSKYGEVELHVSHMENETTKSRTLSTTSSKEGDYYYDLNVPTTIMDRFFVVNDNYTGYEIINERDVSILEKEDANRYNNIQVTKNPTNNRIMSKTCQHLIYKTCSNEYLVPRHVQFANILPTTFQRADLSPVWTTKQSPWMFTRSDKKTTFRHFSNTNIQRQTDNSILAVVRKTIQQVVYPTDFDGLDIIMNCLAKYKTENEKLCIKYEQPNFTDNDIDERMKESHQLACSVKKEFPLWNVLMKDCNTCKQSFGCSSKNSIGPGLETNVNRASVEKVINKIDY